MEPFSHCLDSQRIVNRYTHQRQMVPCCDCEACNNSKSSIMRRRVDTEIKAHRYTLFFTLTYDNVHLPRVRMTADRYGVLQTELVGRSNELFDRVPLFYRYRPYMKKKFVDLEGTSIPHIENTTCYDEFGVLSKVDIQLFMKRLRFKVSQYLKEKHVQVKNAVRYFICGEYGPTTLRPHYHGLFFFDESLLVDRLFDFIVESWGRSVPVPGRLHSFTFDAFADPARTRREIKLCDSNTSYYVADYVAGNNCLPACLSVSVWRPFHLCSQGPSIGMFGVDPSEIFDAVERGVVEHSCVRVDKVTECVVTVSFPYASSDLLPNFLKCKGFRSLSMRAKHAIYSFVHDAFDEWRDLVERLAQYDGMHVSKWLKHNVDYRLRNWLLMTRYDLYMALGMDNDTTYYASVRCAKVVRSKWFRRFVGWSDLVHCYLSLVDRFFTLSSSRKLGQFFNNFNDWFYRYGNKAVVAAYPFMVEDLPEKCRCVEAIPIAYRGLFEAYDLFPLLYSHGCLNQSVCDSLCHEHTEQFRLYALGVHGEYLKRIKVKKRNNTMFRGRYRIH